VFRLTRLPDSVRADLQATIDRRWRDAGLAHGLMAKLAADSPVPVYSMAGRLYASKSGWLLLSVPNALVRGIFDALDEPGLELPGAGPEGKGLEAHISVCRDDEVAGLGGPGKISERGHAFRYQLGPLKSVNPAGQAEFSRCYFVEVTSPELKRLRASYGLSPEPKYPFHITVAYRRSRVLRDNDVAKAVD